MSDYADYAAELAAKHTGEPRPAWECLPMYDVVGQPCRADYLRAGFRMGEKLGPYNPGRPLEEFCDQIGPNTWSFPKK